MLEQPNCFTRKCIHFVGASDDDEPQQKCVCLAFPGGIPEDIAYGTNLHTEPIEGDHGIQFQALPEVAEA